MLHAQDGSTALIDAASKGHVDALEKLLQAGADVNAATKVSRCTLIAGAVEEELRTAGVVVVRQLCTVPIIA